MNRILLIEDDSGAQILYRNRLTDLGYQVVVSPTGAMGLMEARSAPFDLFLVDIDLGSGIDGYEVCRRLKIIPEFHGVPVVLISGHVKAREDLHRGYEAGCQSFLVKGDLMLLEDVVRAMLRIKSLQDDLAEQNRMLGDENRRFEVEKAHSADLEPALSSRPGAVARESARPDGMLLVDGEGVVRGSDRGALDLLGAAIEGKHLARLAPDSRLEALVRNARTEPRESIRFEVPERVGRSARSLIAHIHPFVLQADPTQPSMRLVLLFDPARQRASARVPDEGSAERREAAHLLELAREVYRVSALLGVSPTLRALRERVTRLANSESPVLVRGPSGSGKSLVARILHWSSPRPGPFLALTCGETSDEEFETELFGAREGPARTGIDRPGALQRAAGGTLLLRDIERLSPELQQRLLDSIVLGRVQRSAAAGAERIDVRFVASTRSDLGRAVQQGRFLLGLERCLAAETLALPALKALRDDVPVLARHFLAKHGRSEDTRLAPEALAALAQHDWPDNVRELEQVLHRACSVATTSEIRLSDLPTAFAELGRAPVLPVAARPKAEPSGLERELGALRTSLDATSSLLDEYEKGALLHALRLTNQDKLAAAKLLCIGKSTFYRKLKQHGL